MRNKLINFVILSGMLAAVTIPAAARQTGQIFISSEKDNTITVLDGTTRQQSALIKTCKRPRHMQLTPDRARLLVACGDSGRADIIDIAKKQVVDQVRLEQGVEIFDLSPDGKTLYFSNEDDALLSVVDLATQKVIRNVKVGKEPEGVKVSPDGKIVYVTSEVASMVHVVDAASGKVLKNIEVGKRPRRFAMTPDGKQLWVTNELGASVSIISAADNTVLSTLKFEPKGFRADDITPVGITLSHDGKTAFVALGRANHVAVVDVASRTVKNLILVGKRAWGLALARDDATLYVANGMSDDVSIVDVAKGSAIKSVKAGRVPHSVVIDD